MSVNTQPAPSATAQAGGGASGAGGTPAPGGNEQQNGNQPVTQAALDAHKAEIRQMLDRNYQGVQAMLDRQSGTLKAATETVGRFNKALDGMGVKLTPDQVEQLREQETVRALSQAGETTDTSLPRDNSAGQPQGQEPETGMLSNLALKMMQERGIVILKDDPELALIDQQTQDPQIFMASVDKALAAKVRRHAGLEPEPDGNANRQPAQGGPGINPRGGGQKGTRLLAETKPGGGKTQPGDFLQAGFQESDKFPSAE